MNEFITLRLKTVADNIKRVRLERNYTQEYLGVRLKMSQNAYSKLELNYTSLTLERAIEISIILEVNLLELLGWDYLDCAVQQPAINKVNKFSQLS